MPELLNCKHCGRKVSSEAARRIGGVVVCPRCVPAVKQQLKDEKKRAQVEQQRQREADRQAKLARRTPKVEILPAQVVEAEVIPVAQSPAPAPRRAGPFGWGFGITCGIIAAIIFVIALLVGGCVVLTGGCVAGTGAAVSEAIDEAEKQEEKAREEAQRKVGKTRLPEGPTSGEREKPGPTHVPDEKPPSAEETWVVAGKEAATWEAVQVSVREVKVGHVKVKDLFGEESRSKDRLLKIVMRVANKSSTKKLDFKGWGTRERFSLANRAASLKDNAGNSYKRITFGVGTKVEGQIRTATSVYPGKSVSDVLVFEVPVEAAKHLDLRLPVAALGGKGEMKIRIPKSMIDRESAKAQVIALGIKLIEKAFSDVDIGAGRYKARISLELEVANNLKKPIRAFKGTVIFKDLFGKVIMRVGWTEEVNIPAGGTARVKGGVAYNQFMNSHTRLRTIAKKDLKVEFETDQVIYADGKKESFGG